MDGAELVARLERVWALDAVALAQVLIEQDPTWGTETLALAGGRLVLSGRGLYVNRALAVGIDPALRTADIDLIVARSGAAKVKPTVEVTPATHPDSVAALAGSGFAHAVDGDTSAHVRRLDRLDDLDDLDPRTAPTGISVVPVAERSLDEWKETTALGWGHVTAEARRASDAFTEAARVVDGDGMVLAVDPSDGRPLGCASMTIRDEVATLGGMSTIPAERGRGVQAALILHRLELARAAGCTVAATTTAVGGASERNVQRYGFRTLHIKQTWTPTRDEHR
jgi:GNAT superfamily N-acetyltransferase